MSNLLPITGLEFPSPKAYHFGSMTSEGGIMTFAETLRQLREVAGMTQEALARAIDMSISTVHAYEQGRKEPTMRSLFKLAAALGVSCEAFKECVDIGKPEPEPPAKKGRKRKEKS